MASKMRACTATVAAASWLITLACDSPGAPDYPEPASPPPSSAPPTSVPRGTPSSGPSNPAPRIDRIEIRGGGNTAPIFVGARRSGAIHALTESHAVISSEGALIEVSDTTVARLSVSSYGILGPVPRRDASFSVRFLKAGSVRVRARIGAVTDSLDFEVKPTPPPSEVIAVDSFAIVEFGAGCTTPCAYVAYAPVFRLRETTRAAAATLLGVDLVVGPMRSELCETDVRFEPGAAHTIAGVDPYLWNNDLILVRLDGSRVPADSATAVFYVHEGGGRYGTVQARGPILRIETNPVIPPPPVWGWSC